MLDEVQQTDQTETIRRADHDLFDRRRRHLERYRRLMLDLLRGRNDRRTGLIAVRWRRRSPSRRVAAWRGRDAVGQRGRSVELRMRPVTYLIGKLRGGRSRRRERWRRRDGRRR